MSAAQPDRNVQIRLAARPQGLPKAEDFQRTEEDVPVPGPGEFVARTIYLSLDPAMRGWMTDRKSYIEPIRLGDVMRGQCVAEVMASEHPEFPVGALVSGTFGWQTWALSKGQGVVRLPADTPPELFLGPLGMTGLTAYFGLLDIGAPKEGDTVVVSAAAGAVGSMVGQIARIKGCRVVGIAGGAEKCRHVVEDLGFDAAVDYKAADFFDQLKAACPKGIDVYFDNVGGTILDQCLRLINRGARIPICGAISQYNATDAVPGPANYLALLVQRARMEGFIVFDFHKRYHEALAELGAWVAAGRIQARFDMVDGLDNAPAALNRLFEGLNTGKLLVRVGALPT
jgi:NADPH-dependent curcumin reductase CurA